MFPITQAHAPIVVGCYLTGLASDMHLPLCDTKLQSDLKFS